MASAAASTASAAQPHITPKAPTLVKRIRNKSSGETVGFIPFAFAKTPEGLRSVAKLDNGDEMKMGSHSKDPINIKYVKNADGIEVPEEVVIDLATTAPRVKLSDLIELEKEIIKTTGSVEATDRFAAGRFLITSFLPSKADDKGKNQTCIARFLFTTKPGEDSKGMMFGEPGGTSLPLLVKTSIWYNSDIMKNPDTSFRMAMHIFSYLDLLRRGAFSALNNSKKPKYDPTTKELDPSLKVIPDELKNAALSKSIRETMLRSCILANIPEYRLNAPANENSTKVVSAEEAAAAALALKEIYPEDIPTYITSDFTRTVKAYLADPKLANLVVAVIYNCAPSLNEGDQVHLLNHSDGECFISIPKPEPGKPTLKPFQFVTIGGLTASRTINPKYITFDENDKDIPYVSVSNVKIRGRPFMDQTSEPLSSVTRGYLSRKLGIFSDERPMSIETMIEREGIDPANLDPNASASVSFTSCSSDFMKQGYHASSASVINLILDWEPIKRGTNLVDPRTTTLRTDKRVVNRITLNIRGYSSSGVVIHQANDATLKQCGMSLDRKMLRINYKNVMLIRGKIDGMSKLLADTCINENDNDTWITYGSSMFKYVEAGLNISVNVKKSSGKVSIMETQRKPLTAEQTEFFDKHKHTDTNTNQPYMLIENSISDYERATELIDLLAPYGIVWFGRINDMMYDFAEIVRNNGVHVSRDVMEKYLKDPKRYKAKPSEGYNDPNKRDVALLSIESTTQPQQIPSDETHDFYFVYPPCRENEKATLKRITPKMSDVIWNIPINIINVPRAKASYFEKNGIPDDMTIPFEVIFDSKPLAYAVSKKYDQRIKAELEMINEEFKKAGIDLEEEEDKTHENFIASINAQPSSSGQMSLNASFAKGREGKGLVKETKDSNKGVSVSNQGEQGEEEEDRMQIDELPAGPPSGGEMTAVGDEDENGVDATQMDHDDYDLPTYLKKANNKKDDDISKDKDAKQHSKKKSSHNEKKRKESTKNVPNALVDGDEDEGESEGHSGVTHIKKKPKHRRDENDD